MYIHIYICICNIDISHVWGCWHANAQPGFFQAPLHSRLRFLESCIKPMLKFRWTRWPWSENLGRRLDQLQRHLIGNCLQLRPLSHESADGFRCRRSSATARLQVASSVWSDDFAESTRLWHAHVERRHDPNHWSGHIYEWHAEDWLNEQRLIHSSRNEHARTAP